MLLLLFLLLLLLVVVVVPGFGQEGPFAALRATCACLFSYIIVNCVLLVIAVVGVVNAAAVVVVAAVAVVVVVVVYVVPRQHSNMYAVIRHAVIAGGIMTVIVDLVHFNAIAFRMHDITS
jgi:hypothetical protein